MKYEKLKYAQDLIKTNNPSITCSFNKFILGYDSPEPKGMQGYECAKRMAENGEIAFTHKFRCKCGGYPFLYGGFWVCNRCGRKNVDEDWWKIKVEKDGNEFCCHGLDFVDIMESDNYAFGKTFNEAIDNYGELMAEKRRIKDEER
ncbi:MAG: hypothetical protein KAU20_05720 [Nanoarchaeota archaeon]|nr:hypothetical protein [Nanoarchaeota archaeon]